VERMCKVYGKSDNAVRKSRLTTCRGGAPRFKDSSSRSSKILRGILFAMGIWRGDLSAETGRTSAPLWQTLIQQGEKGWQSYV